jgi:hypothetical protein
MNSNHSGASSTQKRCFVVMGYGKKTDFATGRTLDLDKSYKYLIKPTAEEKGLHCVRADEIPHTGNIDVTMYRELLMADVVIADLSTANPNALYELGVRHALRPFSTVVISENRLPYPFNLNHVRIASYTHLGDVIDIEEAISFRKILGDTLDAVLSDQKIDSPIYTFLNQLVPPSLGEEAVQVVTQAGQALERAGRVIADAATTATEDDKVAPKDETLSVLIEQGEQALDEGLYLDAKTLFSLALQQRKGGDDKGKHGGEALFSHEDAYLLQRLVLATYIAKQPDELSALTEAMNLLDTRLNLRDSKDPQTIKLAGNIERRLFRITKKAEHLTRAIKYYAGGYYLLNELRVGIKYARMLNLRVDTLAGQSKQEQIADLVQANRIRREVLELCESELKEVRQREVRQLGSSPVSDLNRLLREQEARDQEQKFFCLITKAEAHFGLGEFDEYERIRSTLLRLNLPTWKYEKFDRQIGRLRERLKRHGHLLDPPWLGE